MNDDIAGSIDLGVPTGADFEWVTWMMEADEVDALATEVSVDRTDAAYILTATVTASRPVTAVAALRLVLPHGFAVGLFGDGVVQRTDDTPAYACSSEWLDAFYTMDAATGSVAVVPLQPTMAVIEWTGGRGSALTLVVAGTPASPGSIVRDGVPDVSDLVRGERFATGETRTIGARVTVDSATFPRIHEAAVDFSDERDAATHAIALWGSQVPSLGTLEVRGSAYPTINLPRREYGTLHTFFDPDAWSVVASLSYSGVAALRAQARDVIERSLSRITPEGLVPHHFDGDEPTFVAISGSPQPGPNIFLLEASIDHACATGDFAWLADAWRRGLRAASEWLLAQRNPASGLLCVEGALWVDVFRRRGLTLDTNAMAVRTFSRVAQLATLIADPLAAELTGASEALRAGLQKLWSGDHFVTSIDPVSGAVDDHFDAENYLAIAVGAAFADQARAITQLFDNAPQTHPGGRGTWVSLRRYDGPDCYLNNTGDSDIAMARLWWADLLARRTTGDRETFTALYEQVRADLLELVWMRERYAAGGHMTRARGYHEYPGILDMMLREGMYGISLDVLSADIRPMRSGAFSVRFGELQLDYSRDRVVLVLPGQTPREVALHGLHPGASYAFGEEAVLADARGSLHVVSRTDAGRSAVTLERIG